MSHIENVLDKYFGDNRVIYFNAPDLIQANHYVRYDLIGYKVILSVGSDEGEIQLFVCYDHIILENKIKCILN